MGEHLISNHILIAYCYQADAVTYVLLRFKTMFNLTMPVTICKAKTLLVVEAPINSTPCWRQVQGTRIRYAGMKGNLKSGR